jgi:hypothetical protein
MVCIARTAVAFLDWTSTTQNRGRNPVVGFDPARDDLDLRSRTVANQIKCGMV